MEFKPKATVCAALLMLLLLSSYDGGGGMAAEARVCTGKSQHHSFPCISDKICSGTCIKEQGSHWTAGYCHYRICTCQKAC